MTVIDIDDARPYTTATINCSDCSHKWQAVFPTGTKVLECPGCHNAVNEYGTRVLLRRCKTCGVKFTVCPIPENHIDWEHCMGHECLSYDSERDVDKLFNAVVVRRDDDDA